MSIITKIGRFAVKHADVIFAAVGTGVTLVGVGLAVNETLDHADEIKKCKKNIEATKEWTNEADKKTKRKEIAKSYGKSAKCVAKIYLPSIVCLSVGLSSIIFGHKILAKRNAALLVAYEALNKDHRIYRKNIIKDYGKEADICAKHNLVVDDPKKGTLTTPDNDIFIPDRDLSDFAVFFGQEYSELCTDNPEHNLCILKGQEEYANAIFLEQGYLMLQDVYDMLGVDRVAPDGIGWVNGLGDNYIDFGIFNVRNGHAVNGDEQVFLLDFNHDGYILPYI